MYLDKTVVCAANAYEQKYYFNPDFSSLPEEIRQELHIMCVLFTTEIGGIFQLYFDADGALKLTTEAIEGDAMYDEIGGALKVKQLQQEKEELFRNLELYYKVFFLQEDPEE